MARRLAERLPGVRAVHLAEKGRGRALRQVRGASDADMVAYMDVDLSTGLEALLPLVAPPGVGPHRPGHRHPPGQRRRGRLRARAGAGLALLQPPAPHHHVDPLQRRPVRLQGGPGRGRPSFAAGVEDQAWFFDTELLLAAQRGGLRIHEVPVDWVKDTDSRVDVVRTALDDLRGMARVARRQFPARKGVLRP